MTILKEGPEGEQAPYGVNKTNWKFIAIVIVLAILVGGGILGYWWIVREEIKTPEAEIPEKIIINEEELAKSEVIKFMDARLKKDGKRIVDYLTENTQDKYIKERFRIVYLTDDLVGYFNPRYNRFEILKIEKIDSAKSEFLVRIYEKLIDRGEIRYFDESLTLIKSDDKWLVDLIEKNDPKLLLNTTDQRILKEFENIFERFEKLEDFYRFGGELPPGRILFLNALSPDEKKIVFERWDVEFDFLVIKDLETGEETVIAKRGLGRGSSFVDVKNISWAPNSEKVAIAGGGPFPRLGFKIFSINKDIKEIFDFSDFPANFVNNIFFSSNGQKILISSQLGEMAFGSFPTEVPDEGIYVVNADGTNLVRLTDKTIRAGLAIWSEDERKIIYVVVPHKYPFRIKDLSSVLLIDSEVEIWAMNPDGSDKKFLAKGNDPYLYVEE